MFKFHIVPGLNNKQNTEDKKKFIIPCCAFIIYLICTFSPKQSQTSKATVKSTQSDERYEMAFIQVPGVYREERTSRAIPEQTGK